MNIDLEVNRRRKKFRELSFKYQFASTAEIANSVLDEMNRMCNDEEDEEERYAMKVTLDSIEDSVVSIFSNYKRVNNVA